LDTKALRWEARRDVSRELPHSGDGLRVLVDAPHVEARVHEKDEIPPIPAARIENLHPFGDSTAEQLIEQVNVDVAELLAQALCGLRHVVAAAQCCVMSPK